MKVSFEKYYIQIQSPSVCTFIGRINGFAKPENVKAGAFYPFLYLRFADHPNNPAWINHEQIHFRQQLELLFVFYFIILFAEVFYYRFIKKMSQLDAYLISTFEQECYINQNNPHYLNERKAYAFMDYFKHKKQITFVDKEGNIEIE